MEEPTEIWKRLFFVLYNNKQPDDDLPNMWTLFKAKNFQEVELKIAIESISHLLEPGARESLNRLGSAEKTRRTELLYSMKDDPTFNDDFWHLLFRAVRDRGCNPIDKGIKICVLEGGRKKHMTMEEIEEKFVSENKEDLKSSKSIPDQIIHEDLIGAFLNTEVVITSLRNSYEIKKAEAKKNLTAANPKLKKMEAEKQAGAQAKKEVKGSSEAKALQHRVAMIAEHTVQKSIKRAMEEFNIPVYVFRGVNTYDSVGQFIECFGIKMSKLKAFKSGEGLKGLECEHDIVSVALLPSGQPLVSFTQV